jgi:hypothetical protein
MDGKTCQCVRLLHNTATRAAKLCDDVYPMLVLMGVSCSQAPEDSPLHSSQKVKVKNHLPGSKLMIAARPNSKYIIATFPGDRRNSTPTLCNTTGVLMCCTPPKPDPKPKSSKSTCPSIPSPGCNFNPSIPFFPCAPSQPIARPSTGSVGRATGVPRSDCSVLFLGLLRSVGRYCCAAGAPWGFEL